MDLQITLWFQSMASGFMDVVFGAFYYLLNPLFTMIIPIVLYFVFDKRLAYRTAVFYGITSFFCGVFKEIFSRQRPYLEHPREVITRIESKASGASMPSGHAMGSIGLLYPAANQFGYRGRGEKKRIWVFIVTAIVIVMVGFSRIYMGGHYFTDILAGWGFGLLIAAIIECLMIVLKDKFYLYSLLLIPVMVLLICLQPESDSSGVGLAFTSAILIGGFLDHKFVKLDINVVWWRRLIRAAIAVQGAFIFGLLVVTKTFEAIFGYAVNAEEATLAVKVAGYFLMFFVANAWAYIACPYLFKYVPIWFKALGARKKSK